MVKSRSLIAKGRSFQKSIMEKFKNFFGLDEDDIRTAVGAETGVDIKLNKKAREKIGLAIECKNVKSINIWKAIDQAKKNCYEDCEPAVIFKRGTLGSNTVYICVSLKHYLEMRSNVKNS